MSTRCAIAFGHTKNHQDKLALVYRHSDGYPNGAGADLLKFFQDVKACAKHGDTRFDDPTYLAAKFIIWLTLKYANSEWHKRYPGEDHPLNQLGVGVILDYPGDLEYVYVVVCGKRENDPEVYVHNTDSEGSPSGEAIPLKQALEESMR